MKMEPGVPEPEMVALSARSSSTGAAEAVKARTALAMASENFILRFIEEDCVNLKCAFEIDALG